MSPVSHSFLVVKSLISPVIVGVDFLQQQRLSLDFSYCPVRVHHSSQEAASHNSSSEEKKYSSTTAAILQSQKVMRIFKSSNVPFRSSRNR